MPMPSDKAPLLVAVTLDVEEEGLFSGRYPRAGAGLSNIALLERLAFLPGDFGLPLTYLCDYPVAMDPASRELISRLAAQGQGEIGAHLHHWNTPPFLDPPRVEPVPSHLLPPELLKAKFETLFAALERWTGEAPRSHRMGRWDLRRFMLPMLAELGIEVESSIAPRRQVPGGPDHFLAPADPYELQFDHHRLLVAPVTQIDTIPGAGRLVHGLAGLLPGALGESVRVAYKSFGVLGVNPVWMPLATMKAAARMHAARGGRALTMFWHSSELLPGASPHFPDPASVDAFLAKIRDFFAWLTTRLPCRGVTLSQLPDHGPWPRLDFEPGRGEDWR